MQRRRPTWRLRSCLAIALTMMSFMFVGDGLRDALDPRTARAAALAARRRPRPATASARPLPKRHSRKEARPSS